LVVVIVVAARIGFSWWNSSAGWRRLYYGNPSEPIPSIIVLIYIFIGIFIDTASSAIFLNSSPLKVLLCLNC
jgi:TM2 domain-containing membrane protein YozV